MKGYRTFLFNAIMGGVMLVNQVMGTDLDANALLSGLNGLEESITTIWVVGNLWLRKLTDTPLFRKE